MKTIFYLMILSLMACSPKSENKSKNLEQESPNQEEKIVSFEVKALSEKIDDNLNENLNKEKVSKETKEIQRSFWTDKLLKQIDQALDENPVANKKYLPQFQKDIRLKLGFELKCDSDFLTAYESYEIKFCYKAIKALLTAMNEGMSLPVNPKGNFPLHEIVIVKGPNQFYEPMRGRMGLRVNHLISSEEWPALLRSQIEGFSRLNQVHRGKQVTSKFQQIKEILHIDKIQIDEDLGFSEYEKGIFLLEQIIIVEASFRKEFSKKNNMDFNKGAFFNKSWEVLRFSNKNKNLFEDDANFVLGLNVSSTNVRESLSHLLVQANQYGHVLTDYQIALLDLVSSSDFEFSRRKDEFDKNTIFILSLFVQRNKINLLKEDIEEEMFNSEITIEINFDRSPRCQWWPPKCSREGVSIGQAYEFLMNLRQAASGGNLENLFIKKIFIKNSGANKAKDFSDDFIEFSGRASAKTIYEGLWISTPKGREFYRKKLKLNQMKAL